MAHIGSSAGMIGLPRVYGAIIHIMVDSPSTSLAALPVPDCRELEEFCAPFADRLEILVHSLRRRGIPHEILRIGEAKHIILPVPNAGKMDREYYRVTLIAHYDRVEGTPGANDNAAAVFQLLAHWEEIRNLGWQHRTQILFTDKEELTGDGKATDQGSWMLAECFKRLGADNILFFVLDMCGIGDTPVWGRSVRKAGLAPRDDSVSGAFGVMESFLLQFTRGENFAINWMFSDDLGLLLGGYPALQLSLLPHREAKNLAAEFASEPVENHREEADRAREIMRDKLPPTWRHGHGPNDTPETLDAAAFVLMSRILRKLARYRFLLPHHDLKKSTRHSRLR